MDFINSIQETIKKCEDLELIHDFSDAGQLCNDLDDLLSDLNDEGKKY